MLRGPGELHDWVAYDSMKSNGAQDDTVDNDRNGLTDLCDPAWSNDPADGNCCFLHPQAGCGDEDCQAAVCAECGLLYFMDA